MENLIPGLPNEIAMECMVRVPYESHSNMKSVCNSWRNLISHPCFYRERIRSGKAERLVCLVQPLPENITEEEANEDDDDVSDEITKESKKQKKICGSPQYGLTVYNQTRNSWQRMLPENNGIPIFCECISIPSAGKLLLLGGWDPETLQPVDHVYILDFTDGDYEKGKNHSWRRGAPMSVARSFFACALVGNTKVYIAGGHDNNKKALRSAEVYDVVKDEWEKLPDMMEERDECKGLSWEQDSKFVVVSGYTTDNQGVFQSDAECYDPETRVWSKIEKVWAFQNTSPRGTTTSMNVKNERQWWWFLGNNQQSQEQQEEERFGGVKQIENGDMDKDRNWKLITESIQIPSDLDCSSTFVVVDMNERGGEEEEEEEEKRVFVVSGGGVKGGGRSLIMERGSRSGGNKTKWSHVDVPFGFSTFPFSASYLQI